MSNKKPVAIGNQGTIASVLVFFGWSMLLLLVLFDPGKEGTTSYGRGQGGLLGANIMIFFLLFLKGRDIPSMLRAARRVIRRPFSSGLLDYDEFFLTACVVGAIITTIFVVDFAGADLLAVRGGIVIFIIGSKVAFDRWRASKRKV